VRERLATSVHFRLDMGRSEIRAIGELARAIRRHPGDKKAYVHLVRAGDYEAIVSLPDSLGVSPSLDLARELKTRFGYGVLRLH
jgi:hypothetical protein